MKIFPITFIVFLLTTFILRSEDNTMDSRAYALMNAVGLNKSNSKVLRNKAVPPLSKRDIHEFDDNLSIECKENSGNAKKTPSDTLIFKDKYEKVKILGEIKYAPSAEIAQLILFRELAMNSLPLSILVQRYEKKVGGPGEVCIIGKIFDQAKKTFVTDTDPKEIYFIRGNAVVHLKAADTELKIDNVALILDQKLSD